MTGDTSSLLAAKGRSLINALMAVTGVKSRAALVVLLGAVFWAGLFGAAHWFVDQSQRVEIFGDVLVEQLLAMSLLVVFSVLVFSNLVSSFSAYFLADDLEFLMARPIGSYSLYSARFVELLAQSSWMVGLFSLPVFMAIGFVYGTGPTFYLALFPMLLALFVIATALATIVSLLMTNLLPAKRTREVLLLLAALTFVGLFILLRALKPERFLNPDERASLVEVLATVSAPRTSLLPSEWVHRTLWPNVIQQDVHDTDMWLYVTCLFATAAGLFFVGAWLFKALHFEGYSKACEGRPEGSAPERVARRIFSRRSTAAERGKRRLAALSERSGPIGFARQMRKKDARSFIRDTAQWTQLILLFALVVIYLLNFKYIQTIGEGGIIGPVGLYFANLSLSGFVITAICVRFVFPMVSLEGRAFWLVRSAPVSVRRFLWSKWASAVGAIWLFAQFLTIASNLMIGADASLVLTALVVQTPAVIGVVGLGIGLGASYPRFEYDNAAKIATGFGGFAYMMAGLALNLIVVALSYLPTRIILNQLTTNRPLPSQNTLVLAIVFALLVILLPTAVALSSVLIGSRRLEVGG